MLVLTRKSNQSIMIGDNIEVSVLAIMGEKVRIGIQAEREDEEDDATSGEQSDAPSTDTGSSTAEAVGDESTKAGPASDDGAHNGRSAVDAALRSLGGDAQ